MKNRVISNAAWIIGCRIVQSLLSLVVGMLSARFLGPSNYGLINYAASIVGFAVPLMRLGLNSTLVQDISNDENNEGRILGTALGLTIPSSLVSILGIVGFVYFANAGEKETLIVCSVYSVSLLFQASEMITYWYQAKLLSKYPSMAMVVGYVIVSAYKIFLLISGKNVYWFAAANAIDHFVISIILLVLYIVIGKNRLTFSFKTAGKMLAKSKYYIISGMMITIFQQTDKFMLKNIVSDEITGYYSAAVACAGIFGFVYAAIIDSMRPEILKNKRVSEKKYENSISLAYCVIFYASLLQCSITSILAKPMVYILYGEEYLPAVLALRVVVWFVTYSYFGSIRGIWILAEEKYKYVLWIDVSGAVLNIILNLLLIPVLGLIGASVASVVTQFFMNFVMGFFIKPLRRNNILMLKGINPHFAVQQIKAILTKKRKNI